MHSRGILYYTDMWKPPINIKLEINVSCLGYGRLSVMYNPQLTRYNSVHNRLSITFPLNVLKCGYLVGAVDTYCLT